MAALPRWLWCALVGGLIFGLLAGALLYLQAPLLTVEDVKTNRRLFAVPVREGERFVLSYRHSVTQGIVSGTFAVEPDGSLTVKETTFGSPGPGLPIPRPGDDYEISEGMIRYRTEQRLPEVSVFIHPFTEHVLAVKGRSLELSREVAPGALVKIRVKRQPILWRWLQKMGAVLSRAR